MTSVNLTGFGLKSSDVAAIQAIIEAYLLLNGGTGGSTTYAALTDAASVDLPATNSPLSTALGLKATVANLALKLAIASNLSDVNDVATARGNLGAAASGLATASGLTSATAKILGRATAGTGALEELTLGAGMSLVGGALTAATITPGLITEAPEITASRALAATDFGVGVINLNAAGVIALTVPTVAAMALPSTPGQRRVIGFYFKGAGIPTIAGATSSTKINGTAGTTTVLLGSSNGTGGVAPTQWQYAALTQDVIGGDDWTWS